jgi:hypothetical protein
MVVVPRLDLQRDREPEAVGAVVLADETPAAEEVAAGVDRPGHVVLREDPCQAAPQARFRPTSRCFARSSGAGAVAGKSRSLRRVSGQVAGGFGQAPAGVRWDEDLHAAVDDRLHLDLVSIAGVREHDLRRRGDPDWLP